MHQPLPLAFISMPGGYEWIIIGIIALLLFGKRLPGVARSLGQAMHEFKSGLSDKVDEATGGDNEKSAPVKDPRDDRPS